jgi:hypothetical protein
VVGTSLALFVLAVFDVVSPGALRAAPRPGAGSTRWIARSVTSRWRLPAPVYRTMSATVGATAFVLGGLDPAGVTVASVYRFSPSSGGARPAGQLAQPTHGAAALAVGGRVAVFGGASTYVYTTVQSYDPHTHATTVVGSLPGARADLAAASSGATTALLGGFDGYGPLSSVLVGRGDTGFHPFVDLPLAVRYPAVAVSGDDVYLFGGLVSGGEYSGAFTADIQQVDLRTGHAKVVGALAYPVAHAKATVLDGQMIVVGGSTPSGPTSDILRFQPSLDSVSVVGHLPVALTDGALVTIHKRAYYLGGLAASGSRDEIEVIALRATP